MGKGIAMYKAGIGCYRREGEKMVAWLREEYAKQCRPADVTFNCDGRISFYNSWVENRIVDILRSYAYAFGGQADAT